MYVDTVRWIFSLAIVAVFLRSFSVMAFAQERDRSKIPDQYKWDLTAIYPSEQTWRIAKEKFVTELPKIRDFQGTLAWSPKHLADALENASHLEKELARLSVYAGLISDQDTRISTYQAMKQETLQLASRFGAETAFIEPEILKMNKAIIDQFIVQEPRLQVYRQYLEDIQRRRAHTGTDAEEKLLAGATVMATAPECVVIALEAPAGSLGRGSERWPHRQPLRVGAGGQVEEQRAARRLVHPRTLANAPQVGPSPGSVSQASAIRSASAGARGAPPASSKRCRSRRLA